MKACFLFVFAFSAGCGGSSGVNITKTVGAAGGTVSHSDGTSVAIPMGALSGDANITVSSVDATAPAGTVLVGPAYDFGPEGTAFSTPVTITLPFDMAKIPTGRSASDIRIYTAARGSTQYTQLSTTLMSGTVSTETSHFTVYLPAAPKAGVVLDMSSAGGCSTVTCMQTGSGTCSCSQTCGSTVYAMSCEDTVTPPQCGCSVNGSPVPSSIEIPGCSDTTQLMSAFAGCQPN